MPQVSVQPTLNFNVLTDNIFNNKPFDQKTTGNKPGSK